MALLQLPSDHALVEAHAKAPYLPLGRVPYYVFIGRKPALHFPSPACGRG